MASQASVSNGPLVKGISDAGGATGEMVRYDAMCRAIDSAYEVDEVKDIRDKALAFEVYAKQAKNFDAESRACQIRLRAERKVGELLRGREKAKGAAEAGTNRGTTRSDDPTASQTLRDLGISKQQSSNWQRLADVPKEEFEAALTDPVQKPTTAGIIRAAAEPPPTPPGHVQPFSPRPTRVEDDAVWICGRLGDFERDGVLKKDPDSVLLTMTAAMLEDVEDYAPKVADWISRLAKALSDRGGVP